MAAGVGHDASGPQYCEQCGAALHPDTRFCATCGTPVDNLVRTATPSPPPPPAGATTSLAANPTPPPPPASEPPRTPGPPGAALEPPAPATPWFRRRGPLLGLVSGLAVVVLAVVLLIVLSGGGSGGPTKAQIEARKAAAAHAAAVQQATDALNALNNAWGTETTTHNSLTNQEGSVVNANNLGAARFILQSEADALNTMIGSVGQITFPPSAEPDARGFLTAANNELGALQSLVSDPNDADFNSKIDAINTANTALNGAHDLLQSDLETASNGS